MIVYILTDIKLVNSLSSFSEIREVNTTATYVLGHEFKVVIIFFEKTEIDRKNFDITNQ